MIKPLIILLLSIIMFNCFSQTNSNTIKEQRSNCLLIEYSEYTECKYLLDSTTEREFPTCDCSNLNIQGDYFSEYFPLRKVFYADGNLTLAPSTSVLFWDYSYFKIIDTFPINYSNVRLIKLINDSTISILINKKVINLTTNETYKDTITFLKREDDNLKKFTTVIRIRNIGLLDKNRIFDNRNWEQKCKELELSAPNIAEKMPEFPGGKKKMMTYLYENINIPEHYKNKEFNTKLFADLVIDSKGWVSVVRLSTCSGIEKIDNMVIKAFETMPKWAPGIDHGVNIAVSVCVPLTIKIKQ